jgi:peroxiredoxin
VREEGVELYAVSVDPPDVSRRLREHLAVRFTFLSDGDGVLLDALGIRHRGGNMGEDIAFPTAILVDEDGVIRWAYQSDTYRERARPEDIFAAIDALDARVP